MSTENLEGPRIPDGLSLHSPEGTKGNQQIHNSRSLVRIRNQVCVHTE